MNIKSLTKSFHINESTCFCVWFLKRTLIYLNVWRLSINESSFYWSQWPITAKWLIWELTLIQINCSAREVNEIVSRIACTLIKDWICDIHYSYIILDIECRCWKSERCQFPNELVVFEFRMIYFNYHTINAFQN